MIKALTQRMFSGFFRPILLKQEESLRLKTRLISGTFLNFLATVFNQGSTLVVNIIVARILMKEGFGEYAMVQNTLLTLATVAQLAMGYTASKYVAEYRTISPDKAGRIMGLCAIVSALMACAGAVLMMIMAPWLAGAVLKAPHLANGLTIGSGYLFFSSINGYQTGAMSGLEAYGSLTKAGFISGIVAIIAISFGAWSGGLNGALVGLSITAFIRYVIHNRWFQLERQARGLVLQYRGLSREKSAITGFALPAAIAGYYSLPMIWLASFFLVRQPNGYNEMALYASSSSIRMIVLFIPQVINTVSLSILNNIKGSGNQQHYNRVYCANVLFIFTATLTAGLIIGFSGDTILSIFGKDFSAGKIVLQVLMFSAVFEGISIALHQHIQSQGKMWTSFLLITIPKDTIFIILAFWLIPLQKAIGLSWSFFFSWVLAFFVVIMMVYSLGFKGSK